MKEKRTHFEQMYHSNWDLQYDYDAMIFNGKTMDEWREIERREEEEKDRRRKVLNNKLDSFFCRR